MVERVPIPREIRRVGPSVLMIRWRRRGRTGSAQWRRRSDGCGQLRGREVRVTAATCRQEGARWDGAKKHVERVAIVEATVTK